MDLVDKIIQGWKKKVLLPPNVSEDTLGLLASTVIAVVRTELIEHELTTDEAIHVHSALSMLKIVTMPKFPLPEGERLSILENLVTPEVVSATEKIESYLKSLGEIRKKGAGVDASNSFPENLEDTDCYRSVKFGNDEFQYRVR